MEQYQYVGYDVWPVSPFNFYFLLYLLEKVGAASRYQQSPFLFVLFVCDVY